MSQSLRDPPKPCPVPMGTRTCASILGKGPLSFSRQLMGGMTQSLSSAAGGRVHAPGRSACPVGWREAAGPWRDTALPRTSRGVAMQHPRPHCDGPTSRRRRRVKVQGAMAAAALVVPPRCQLGTFPVASVTLARIAEPAFQSCQPPGGPGGAVWEDTAHEVLLQAGGDGRVQEAPGGCLSVAMETPLQWGWGAHTGSPREFQCPHERQRGRRQPRVARRNGERELFLRGRWWEVPGFMGTPARTNGGTRRILEIPGWPGSVRGAAMRDRGAAAGAGSTGGGIERPGVPGGKWAVPEDCRALPGSARGFQGDTDG